MVRMSLAKDSLHKAVWASQKDAPQRNWAAVKELKLSYYIGETILFTCYTHYCT